jgi:hypothetical protein
MTAPPPLPRAIAGWPREWQEEFVHRAGTMMSDGMSVERADHLALSQVRELMKAKSVHRAGEP